MGDTPPMNVGLDDGGARVTLAGKIMVGTIVTLFFVVVIILGIHIYARLYLWRRSGGRRRRFVFASADGMAAAEVLRRGVDPAVLKSIPVMVFSSVEHKNGLECAVCLAEVVEGEKVRMLPNCNHGFHVGCIDMWLHSHSTCPLCRSPMVPQTSEQMVTSENSVPSADGAAANLPTNVLFWGNEVQVSSRIVSSDEGPSGRPVESLVIDIPRNNLCDRCSSAGLGDTDQNEVRSPLSARFRSLTRLWSMNNKVSPSSSGAPTDLEQGDGRV